MNSMVKFHLLPYSAVRSDGVINKITNIENSFSILNLFEKHYTTHIFSDIVCVNDLFERIDK